MTDHESNDRTLGSVGSGPHTLESFNFRHGIRAAPNLTVVDDEVAMLIAERLAPRIAGRTVVEIGGGTGLLSMYMAAVARRVICIEANPVWSHMFVDHLLKHKPKNLVYVFGAADEMQGLVRADIAVVCTHSDVQGMLRAGALFADTVVDVYGELIEANPGAFDEWARNARYTA